MTTVRIAHAEPRPGDLGNGSFVTNGWLVVLADDAGHRALPIWLNEPGGGSLSAGLIVLTTETQAPGIFAVNDRCARLASSRDDGSAADFGPAGAPVSFLLGKG
jgi:hypothetical protein